MAAGNKGKLATAFVQIMPTFEGVTGNIRKEFQNAFDGVGSSSKKAGANVGDQIVGGFASKMTSGFAKAGKTAMKITGGALLAGGTAAVGLAGAAISKGIERSINIENAQAKLTGLGHSTESVSVIMDSALKSVTGTAYGFGDAASAAASAVAAGVKPGQELTKYLSLTGDAAAIAGVSFGEMGSIFNKIQTSGIVQAEEMNQVMDRGIPIYELLADAMGQPASKIKELGSQGKITSADFLKAMESMEGAALEAGNTTQGAFDNMGASFGRLGEVLIGTGFGLGQLVFSEVSAGLDALTEGLKPILESMQSTVVPAIESVVSGVGPKIAEFILGIMPMLQSMGTAIGDVFVRINESIAPLLSGALGDGTLTEMFNQFGIYLGLLITEVGNLAVALAPILLQLADASWSLFVGALNSVVLVLTIINPLLQALSNILTQHPWILTTIVSLMTAYVLVMKAAMIIQAVSGAIKTMQAVMVALRGATIAGTMAQLGLNAAMWANPFGLIVLAILAIIAVIVVVIVYFDDLISVLMTVWEWIKKVFTQSIPSWFGNIFGGGGGGNARAAGGGGMQAQSSGFSTMSVPALATGADVMGPTIALLGEKDPETVVNRGSMNKLIENVNAEMSNGGGRGATTINVYQQPGESTEALAKRIEEYQNFHAGR